MSTVPTKQKQDKKQEWPYITWSEKEGQWKVDARTSTGGSRRFFDLKSDADTFRQQCRATRNETGLILFGHEELAEFGKTPQDAIAFYLAHLRSQKRSMGVKEGIALYIVRLEQIPRSPRYINDMRTRLATFEEKFGAKQFAELPPDDISEWLDAAPVAAATRNTMRRRLSSLFSFVKEKKWRPDNPFAGGKKAEVKRIDEPRKKVKILFYVQVVGLLRVASGQTFVFWALAIFAGLRPESEILRLQWEHIDFEQFVIVVDGAETETEETKTGRRVVKMSENLRDLILPYAKPSGPIVECSATVMWKKLRADKRKVGFGTPGNETPEEKAAKLKLTPWTEDITRHTFGSNLLAACGDIGVVSTQMGNSPDMVRKHYLALVKPSDAARFWKIHLDDLNRDSATLTMPLQIISASPLAAASTSPLAL